MEKPKQLGQWQMQNGKPKTKKATKQEIKPEQIWNEEKMEDIKKFIEEIIKNK